MPKITYKEGDFLPIGFKHGCYTIIAGFEAYQEEVGNT